MSHLVHLAAPSVRAGSVIRQRCGWCGALIDEIDLDNIAVNSDVPMRFTDDRGDPINRWYGLVAVEVHGDLDAVGVTQKWVVDQPADGKIPKDSCMAMPLVSTG